MGKKRAHGEGTVYQRSDGRWCAQLAVVLPDGRLVRRTVYGKTQREAREKLDRLRSQLASGLALDGGRVRLADYLAEWLAAQEGRLRPRTLHRYQELVAYQVVPFLGSLRLDQLTPSGVERWQRTLVEQGLSAKTAEHARAVLRRALADAERDGLVARNAARLARPLAVPRPIVSCWTREEAQRFLTATLEHWLWPLFALALATGMRQGELLGLSWEDVGDDTLLVRRQLQRIDGRYHLVPLKTERSLRELPLSPLAREALAVQCAQQAEWRATPLWDPTKPGAQWQLVFTSHAGSPLIGRDVTRSFQTLAAAAGVPVVRFHDLRHTAATLLLEQGVDVATVSRILGHTTIATTVDRYGHLTLRATAPALDRLAGALRPLQ